jgi:hypothetical protein
VGSNPKRKSVDVVFPPVVARMNSRDSGAATATPSIVAISSTTPAGRYEELFSRLFAFL